MGKAGVKDSKVWEGNTNQAMLAADDTLHTFAVVGGVRAGLASPSSSLLIAPLYIELLCSV